MHYEYLEGSKQKKKKHWLICGLEEHLVEGNAENSMAPRIIV